MSTVEEWATRLAAAVAPAEAERAPEWIDAFMAGEEERQDLLVCSRGRATRGMMVDPVVLPFVFQAIAHTGPKLLGMISLGNAGETLGFMYYTLGLRELLKKEKHGTETDTPVRATTEAKDHAPSMLSEAEMAAMPGAAATLVEHVALPPAKPAEDAPPVPASPPSEDRVELIRSVVQTMTKELQATRLSRDECDLMTYRVLKVLLDDPGNAPGLVQALAGAPAV